MDWKIPLFKIYSDQNDLDAVNEVIKRGTSWAIGPEIEEFENAFAVYVGRKYALSFNSGTSALYAMLLAYDIKGKEVIIPTFTFIATANAVVLAGGIPIFAESENDTFGLDYNDVLKRITPNTIGIMPIHYGGCGARDIEKIRKLCYEKKLFLFEDAAQSLGSMIHGKKIGTYGDAAMFSLCQNKIITSGEGGIIVTDQKEIYEKLKLIRSHGRVELGEDYFSNTKDNDYIVVGYNYRMSTMTAALAYSQLKKINQLIKIRQDKAKYLNDNLGLIKNIKLPIPLKNYEHVYQMYTISLNSEKERNELQDFLKIKNIMTKVYFNPIHLKTLYTSKYGYKVNDLPITEELSKKVLTLPLYVNMTYNEMDYLINSVKEFFEKKTRSELNEQF